MRNDKYAHLTCKLTAAIYQVEATLEQKKHNCALQIHLHRVLPPSQALLHSYIENKGDVTHLIASSIQ